MTDGLMAAYIEQTRAIEHEMLTKCQDAAGEGVTRFQIWHGPEGDAIIECYRIAPNQILDIRRQLHEDKVFVIHRYKFGSPYREDK